RAVARAGDARARGTRLVLLARALERTKQLDSARVTYDLAARDLAPIADWLALRALALDPDSARRAARAAALTLDPARARALWAEAQARERLLDWSGAAAIYERLGQPVDMWRVRLLAASDSASRASVRTGLFALVETRGGTPLARSAVEILDASFPTHSASEELIIGRSAAASGPVDRAVRGLSRALTAGLGTPQDRFSYATLLSRTGKDADAARQFAKITTGPLAGRAAYQRARSLLRSGSGDAASAALDRLLARFPRDTAAASSALFLRADLASDAQRDAAARAGFRRLAARYPTSALAAEARFRAALIAYIADSARVAAAELDTLARRYPSSDEALPALYWSARSWEKAGDSAAARERWQRVLKPEPVSYYALLAARRTGAALPAIVSARDSFTVFPDLDAAMRRASLLEDTGMAPEAGWEYDAIAAAADSSVERLLATAAAFRDRAMSVRAINLARRALARGAAADARTYRLVYPLVQQDALLAEAAEHKLDPILVAALIRQESSFYPQAISPAGARGLMQLMPSLGSQLARAARFPTWDVALLWQPDVNMQLGMTHLATLMRADTVLAHVLAAYNAGEARVDRWTTKHGTSDPEIFVERIPYAETRDYVRIIERNRFIYHSLYVWR
ncbi:MAG TPA: transglycosylase SLT domain-containing protein, partial [Gemmatimonadaceae bacterium]